MPARSIWKGVIRFEGVAVPVKLYSAVEDRKIHFRLLHERDHTPVEQRMVDPRTGSPVPGEQIRRGCETESGDIVILSDEELDSLSPEPSRDIDITRFVDPDRINHRWYDRPYFLGPDGDREDYFALAEALEKEKKEGVARWTMRKKRYVGALSAEGRYLRLVTLRHAGEVVEAAAVPRPEGRALEPMELQMAEQLVGALAAEFDAAAFKDEYRERVMELIQTKARGDVYIFEKEKKRRPRAAPLADILEQSLEQARRRKRA